MLRRKQVPFLHRFPIAYSLVCEPRYTSRYELDSSSHAYVCYHMIHAVLVGGQNRLSNRGIFVDAMFTGFPDAVH